MSVSFICRPTIKYDNVQALTALLKTRLRQRDPITERIAECLALWGHEVRLIMDYDEDAPVSAQLSAVAKPPEQ